MITVLHEQRETEWPDEVADGESLWLDAAAIEKATGWRWKLEGLCHGDLCLPVPPGRAAAWTRDGAREGEHEGAREGGRESGQDGGPTGAPGRASEAARPVGQLDLAAMWRHSGQPVVHDDARRTWVLGTGSTQRAAALTSLQAPDFALPDLEGREHRLSALRGRKVFLATWASW